MMVMHWPAPLLSLCSRVNSRRTSIGLVMTVRVVVAVPTFMRSWTNEILHRRMIYQIYLRGYPEDVDLPEAEWTFHVQVDRSALAVCPVGRILPRLIAVGAGALTVTEMKPDEMTAGQRWTWMSAEGYDRSPGPCT
jgi:hypothetical protein